MYYARFDSQGNRLASYHTDIHNNIPTDAIEVSDADQELYATNNYIRGTDGKPILKPAYVPTETEILTTTKNKRLAEIKTKLATTDYKTLKFIDGDITASDYDKIKALRKSLRVAYNEIEAATTVEKVNAANY